MTEMTTATALKSLPSFPFRVSLPSWPRGRLLPEHGAQFLEHLLHLCIGNDLTVTCLDLARPRFSAAYGVHELRRALG